MLISFSALWVELRGQIKGESPAGTSCWYSACAAAERNLVESALEVLNTRVILLKQYTEIGVNWLITIGNKTKANIQIVIQIVC